MNYTKDASTLAAEYARRENQHESLTMITPVTQIWGRLTITDFDTDVVIEEATRVTLDLSKPGMLIAYDETRTAVIFAMKPGWIAIFTPDDAGQ